MLVMPKGLTKYSFVPIAHYSQFYVFFTYHKTKAGVCLLGGCC